MAENYRTYAKKEWWREEGEVSDKERRMTEATKKREEYDLKVGDDGRNHPSIVTKYASGSKKQAEAKKTLTVKKFKEDEFEDQDEYSDQTMDTESELGDEVALDDEGINDESDIPMESEEAGEGCVCTCPSCGAKLVIETSEEEELEGELDDEGLDGEMDLDTEEHPDIGVESEDSDLTVPKMEAQKDKFTAYKKKMEAKKNSASLGDEKSFEKAYQEWKSEKKKRIEAISKKSRKSEAESEIGVEYGSDTPKIVKKGQTNSGSKTDVGEGNSDDFGIAPKDTGAIVKKGASNSGSKSSVSEKQRMARKAIAEEQQATTDSFEDLDDASAVTGDDGDYADIPLEVGADSDSISQYENVQKRRKARKEGASMKESAVPFDFKRLVRGEYK